MAAEAAEEAATKGKKSKEPIGPELTPESFIWFALTMAYDLVMRRGEKEGPNPYLARLPDRIQKRFVEKRRCTFSWMTDKTSLALATKLLACPNDRVEALRLMVLAQCLITGQADFDALADKVRCKDEQQILGLRKEAARERKGKDNKERKTLVGPGLQQGMLSMLGCKPREVRVP